MRDEQQKANPGGPSVAAGGYTYAEAFEQVQDDIRELHERCLKLGIPHMLVFKSGADELARWGFTYESPALEEVDALLSLNDK